MNPTPERSTDRATARRVPATPGALAELARHRSQNMPTLESFIAVIDASFAELERRGLFHADTIIKLNAVATELGFGEVADPMWAWPGAMPYLQLEDVLGRGPRSRLRTLRERVRLRMAVARTGHAARPIAPANAGEEWLVPGRPLADLANRLGNIGPKKARTALLPYGLRNAGNRQLWTCRLDSMPASMREKLTRD